MELAVCEVLAERGVIPARDMEALRGASFEVEAVKEREQVTDHDVAAFVDVAAASVGKAGRWIHYGLTSSDVLDTGLALQLRDAGKVAVSGAGELIGVLVAQAREFRDTLCIGRTHGVHAEPTTFGLKLAGFAFESRAQPAAAGGGLRAARRGQALRARSAPTRRSTRRREGGHGRAGAPTGTGLHAGRAA